MGSKKFFIILKPIVSIVKARWGFLFFIFEKARTEENKEVR